MQSIERCVRSNIIFVGIGRSGCKVAEILHNKGYHCLFVDSDIEELNKLSVDSRCVFSIPRGSSARGDRNKVGQYFNQIKEDIIERITFVNGNANNVFFIFSMGGGLANLAEKLMQYCSEKMEGKNTSFTYKKRYISAIPIINVNTTDLKIKMNVLESFNNLNRLKQYICNYIFLEDDGEEISDVGNRLVEGMSKLICGNGLDKRETIDEANILERIKSQGCMYWSKLSKSKDKYRLENEGIFPFSLESLRGKDAYISISQQHEKDDIIKQIPFHKRFYDFVLTYNQTNNTYIYVFEAEFPIKIIDSLKQELKKELEQYIQDNI